LLLPILCIALIFVFITYSSSCIPAAADSLMQCFRIVIPSIFPFLVITEILTKTNLFQYIGCRAEKLSNLLFKTSGNALSVVLIGYLCGFPGAAKITTELYRSGNISYSDALRLSMFTNNPGPLFMIGTVGLGFLNSVSLGLKLYLIQIAASFFTGIVLSRLIKIKNSVSLPSIPQKKSGGIFELVTESITSSFFTMIPITGTIVFFSFLSQAIVSSNLFNTALSIFTTNYNKDLLNGCIRCFFELTSGLSSIIPIFEGSKYLLITISLVCGWSGISIHMQILNFYIKEKIPIRYYFIGKSFSVIVVLILTILIW